MPVKAQASSPWRCQSTFSSKLVPLMAQSCSILTAGAMRLASSSMVWRTTNARHQGAHDTTRQFATSDLVQFVGWRSSFQMILARKGHWPAAARFSLGVLAVAKHSTGNIQANCHIFRLRERPHAGHPFMKHESEQRPGRETDDRYHRIARRGSSRVAGSCFPVTPTR